MFAQIAADLKSLEYDVTKTIKKTLLMADWVAEVRTQDVEARYHVWAGAVRRTGEEYGWLVDALAGVARASGWPDARSEALDVLAARVSHGVRADALPLARLHARGVGRGMLRRLVDAGLSDREALRAAGRDAVAGALKNKTATAALWSTVAGPGSGAPTTPPVEVGAATKPAVGGEGSAPLLVVDLRSRNVTYRGHPIPTMPPHNLRPQSILALAVLASRPGKIVPMDDLAIGMRKLGRSKRRMVTPESREIRYQVLRSFRRALDGIVAKEEIDSILDNIPGAGLRLNALARVDVIVPVDV